MEGKAYFMQKDFPFQKVSQYYYWIPIGKISDQQQFLTIAGNN